ncbi:hypothetical protein HPB51_002507 [Rhipicephalus microplus]|uniref:Kinetochore protein Nuf2 N-terminal domain-containing protein n=1 Tax=Rhipicephalus microplus TaxID=6941 RepID=A0A9J6DF56_RHIMP|nr:hypothetical protein HPB51_002507 [Rhipicephalus microplus]
MKWPLEVPRSLLPSEAMHIEGSIPIGHYLKLMQVVLGIVGVNDVGLQDLTNPKPRRTRRLLKILVNKLLQATAVFSKYTDEAVASELSACKKTLAAYAEEKAVIVSDYQQLKTTLCDSAEAVEKAKLQIMELKEALEEKRAAVCRDPASWKENISADVETLATLESEIEKLRSIVSTVNEKVSLSPRISEEYSKSLESLAGMEEHAAEVEMLQQTKTAQEKKR